MRFATPFHSAGWFRCFLIVLSAVVTLLVQLFAGSWLQHLEERSGDWFWRLGASAEQERRLVLIDIDDASISRVGSWPWPRERVAELVDKLASAGAQGIALDIVFPDSRSGDAQLSQALGTAPVVLSEILALNDRTAPAEGVLQGGQAGLACEKHMPRAKGYIANASSLAAAAGHITPRIDEDGAVRHLPALICYEGQAYATLTLALLQKSLGSGTSLEVKPGAGWSAPHHVVRFSSLPGLEIPVDSNGDVRVPYARLRSGFISISASDVLENRFSEQLLKGSLVIVGATAFGLTDAVPTPHGGAVSGVEVHAQFLSGVLDHAVPYTPKFANAAQWLMALFTAVVLFCFASARIAQGRMAIWLPISGIFFAAMLAGIHGGLLLGKHLWIGWIAPALFTFIAAICLAAGEHARLRFERFRLYENLAAYLPAPVARLIALSEVKGIIEAERREVTVLFADIRNFSAYCEGRPPEEAAAMLHAFFTTSSAVVEAHGGVIEEFVGDAIMAVWNAPVPCDQHTLRGFEAAKALHSACAPLFSPTPPPGLEPLALGVGLETGQALVGSFGPVKRRTHGALGETVTIAERLTALTTDVAQPILVGETAAAALRQEVALRDLGSFQLEGLRRPRRVFSPELSEE